MSIVRIGMSEDGKFGAGYDAIFGTQDSAAKKSTTAKKATTAKKPAAKKPAKKAAKKK